MSQSQPPNFNVPAAPNEESIRLIVVGTARTVNNFITTQHRLGFAEVLAWSPPLPTPHSNQIMRILTKRLSLEENEAIS
ncbi:MAG: hypothetical protein AAFX01_03655 [Cyanobacteria bacterium J06638_28]